MKTAREPMFLISYDSKPQWATVAIGVGKLVHEVSDLLYDAWRKNGAEGDIDPVHVWEVARDTEGVPSLRVITVDRVDSSWDRLTARGYLHYALDSRCWARAQNVQVHVLFCPQCRGTVEHKLQCSFRPRPGDTDPEARAALHLPTR